MVTLTSTDGSDIDLNGVIKPSGSVFGNLSAGYYIAVSAGDPPATAAFNIINTNSDIFAYIEEQTHVSCHGLSDGSVFIKASGGFGPYYYKLNNNPPQYCTGLFENLAAGSYNVLVTDGEGCTFTVSFHIQEPTLLTLSVVSLTDVLCKGGSTGSVALSAAGGTTPYSYSIIEKPEGADPDVDNNLFTNMQAGDYIVGVTDINGCTATTTLTISEPAEPLLATYTVEHVICHDGNTGSATISTTGGTPPYHYLWSNGSTDKTAAGLQAGLYDVEITDANGCRFELFYIEITQPEEALTAHITSKTNPLCQGSNNGSASIEASGGTPPYQYLWSNGDTEETATGLTAGTHYVTVTDANGCSTKVSLMLTDTSVITVTLSNKINVSCFGENNGQATVTASGGTPPYTYLWDDPDAQTTATAYNLTAGQYSVTVTDDNGCESSTMVEITQPLLLVAETASISMVSCHGSSDGSATVYATGGLTPYTYLWNDSDNQTTATASNLEAGTYTVSVTDANGCQAEAIAVIAEPEQPVSATYNIEDVLCYGQSTGSISLQPEGGTKPYSYLWSNGQAGQTAYNLEAGIYSVTITDAMGCTLELTDLQVFEPYEPLAAGISQVTNIDCAGNQNGSISVTASGGTPPYQYLWNNGATTATITGLAAGTYHVTVTDENNCSYSLEQHITEPQEMLIMDIVVRDVVCKEDSLGSIDYTITGGVPPYEYLWNNGKTTRGLYNMPGGFYEVTIRDMNGCETFQEFEIGYEVEDCELRVPNGISMNDSGFNDRWIINGLFRYPNNKAQVFNRWGTLVYEASPYNNDWDGKPNRGRIMTESDGRLPSGTYYYIIQLEPGLEPLSGYLYLGR